MIFITVVVLLSSLLYPGSALNNIQGKAGSEVKAGIFLHKALLVAFHRHEGSDKTVSTGKHIRQHEKIKVTTTDAFHGENNPGLFFLTPVFYVTAFLTCFLPEPGKSLNSERGPPCRR